VDPDSFVIADDDHLAECEARLEEMLTDLGNIPPEVCVQKNMLMQAIDAYKAARNSA
jgi:hypothetical protein